jgi:hypothetical protein
MINYISIGNKEKTISELPVSEGCNFSGVSEGYDFKITKTFILIIDYHLRWPSHILLIVDGLSLLL